MKTELCTMAHPTEQPFTNQSPHTLKSSKKRSRSYLEQLQSQPGSYINPELRSGQYSKLFSYENGGLTVACDSYNYAAQTVKLTSCFGKAVLPFADSC